MDSGKLAAIQALRRGVGAVLAPLAAVYEDLCRLEDRELGLVEEPHCIAMEVALTGEDLAAFKAAAALPGKLVPAPEVARHRNGGGRKPGGRLGRASGRVLEKAAANPGGPRKALGQGLSELRRQREGDMRLRHRMHGLFGAPPREANAEPVPDWSPVPAGEGRQVEIDGGASFEVAE